jgi:hypothetical protein
MKKNITKLDIKRGKEMNELTTTNEQMPIEELSARIATVKVMMKELLQANIDYGVIPNTNDKPVLLKPGAEKLCQLFHLAPHFVTNIDRIKNEHINVYVKCELRHIKSNETWATGSACCSTLETKYRYRKVQRLCPKCNVAAIIKGRVEYGGGWVCFAKHGGCGAKYNDNDRAITNQVTGRVENEDIADQYNTVIKMAEKRAYIAATLFATASSGLFTQDREAQVAPTSPPATSQAPPQKPTSAPQRRNNNTNNNSERANGYNPELKAILSGLNAFVAKNPNIYTDIEGAGHIETLQEKIRMQDIAGAKAVWQTFTDKYMAGGIK